MVRTSDADLSRVRKATILFCNNSCLIRWPLGLCFWLATHFATNVGHPHGGIEMQRQLGWDSGFRGVGPSSFGNLVFLSQQFRRSVYRGRNWVFFENSIIPKYERKPTNREYHLGLFLSPSQLGVFPSLASLESYLARIILHVPTVRTGMTKTIQKPQVIVP
jgi:hypothetical protein